MASLALSCCSVVSKRALMELPSSATADGITLAAFNASSTRAMAAVSTLALILEDETCTAGASPKKLGKV